MITQKYMASGSLSSYIAPNIDGIMDIYTAKNNGYVSYEYISNNTALRINDHDIIKFNILKDCFVTGHKGQYGNIDCYCYKNESSKGNLFLNIGFIPVKAGFSFIMQANTQYRHKDFLFVPYANNSSHLDFDYANSISFNQMYNFDNSKINKYITIARLTNYVPYDKNIARNLYRITCVSPCALAGTDRIEFDFRPVENVGYSNIQILGFLYLTPGKTVDCRILGDVLIFPYKNGSPKLFIDYSDPIIEKNAFNKNYMTKANKNTVDGNDQYNVTMHRSFAYCVNSSEVYTHSVKEIEKVEKMLIKNYNYCANSLLASGITYLAVHKDWNFSTNNYMFPVL